MNIPLESAELRRGIDLFNCGHFFEAHEVLEDVWRFLPRDLPSRRHCQGLVQLAVAFHHQSTGNHVGARSVLERALRNLSGANNTFPAFDLDRLRQDLEPWRKYLEPCKSSLNTGESDSMASIRRSVPHRIAPVLPKILRQN